MSRRVPDEAHGLSMREAQVMDRLDRGVPHGAVARELGLALGYIAFCDRLYGFERGARPQSSDAATRAADARYQAALRASGGRFA